MPVVARGPAARTGQMLQGCPFHLFEHFLVSRYLAQQCKHLVALAPRQIPKPNHEMLELTNFHRTLPGSGLEWSDLSNSGKFHT
jgi:hypothetical protein